MITLKFISTVKKKKTKPNRKMGHITVTDNDLKEGLSKQKTLKN